MTLLNQCLKARLRNCQKNFHSPCFKRNPPSSVGYSAGSSINLSSRRRSEKGQGGFMRGSSLDSRPKVSLLLMKGLESGQSRCALSASNGGRGRERRECLRYEGQRYLLPRARKTIGEGITKGNKGKKNNTFTVFWVFPKPWE